MLRLHGAWRITVVGKNADFDQRAVVRGPHGARVLPGRVGASLDVDEDSWALTLEHHLWARSWQPNLRTTPGPVTERDGVRSRLLVSNDCHWPGKPLDYVNFVLRLDQLPAAAPHPLPVRAAVRHLAAVPPDPAPARPARHLAAVPPPPAAPRAVRTSSDGPATAAPRPQEGTATR
ncbi:hypothetical protein [Kitasatospora sp. NPDC048538]|uniref:hypothetical protein n=1 Tax=unclassified Kitasatospora TaxID=2633591 RepID=UPI0033FBCE08